MSTKPDTHVVAILLPTGEVDYRMRDDAMGEALSHPDARLGVMVFYGHGVQSAWYDPRTGRRHTPGYRFSSPPVFVYDKGAFRLRRERQPAVSPWAPTAIRNRPEYRWWITQNRETSALVDEKKIAWVLNDWLERNT
jgi:hypothetical protein